MAGVSFPGESAAYRVARDKLLADEIALRRQMESVAVQRRALPAGGLAPEDYVFEAAGPGEMGKDGAVREVRLSELFEPGKGSLIVYNFMFPRMPQDLRPGPMEGETAALKREDGPCPSCTAFLDTLDRTAGHLAAAGGNFVVIAKAPMERVTAFAKDRGWKNLRLLSAAKNNFKRDYLAETAEGMQLPVMSVFQKDADGVRHFWSSEMMFEPGDPGQDPRHNGPLETLWNLFDLTPEGRPMQWHEQISYGCCGDGAMAANPGANSGGEALFEKARGGDCCG